MGGPRNIAHSRRLLSHSLHEYCDFIALFVLVYVVVFGTGISYIRHLIKKGPETKPAEASKALANRPISAALTDEVRSPESGAVTARPAE